MSTWAAWDDEESARLYEAFCERHPRYAEANATLVANAAIERADAVLDVAAGTGRTAEQILPLLGPAGSLTCFEPAQAMANIGRSRLSKSVEWLCDCPTPPRSYDRVLCGSAIWQMLPLAQTIERLARLLAPNGRLCFNIPSLYLGLPDDPGDGPDPNLLEFVAVLAQLTERGTENGTCEPEVGTHEAEILSPEAVDHALAASGLTWRRWESRGRLTLDAYRDWLKIPAVSGRMFGGRLRGEGAALIDRAYELSQKGEGGSWRWEGWLGWTAWKP